MADNDQERRLAAILAADVVGYSRLMGEDEAGTLLAIRKLRAELIEPRITEHKGRLFKAMGDGFLAEFPSVVNAVACAVAVQKAIAARNADLPEGPAGGPAHRRPPRGCHYGRWRRLWRRGQCRRAD